MERRAKFERRVEEAEAKRVASHSALSTTASNQPDPHPMYRAHAAPHALNVGHSWPLGELRSSAAGEGGLFAQSTDHELTSRDL